MMLGVLAVGGIVFAQTVQPTRTPNSNSGQSGARAGAQAAANDFLSKLAQNLGISQDTLTNALKKTSDQEVDTQVTAGKITSAQGTQIKQRIDSGQFPPIGAFAFGGHPGGPGPNGLGACKPGSAVASALGVTPSDLQSAIKSGQTFSQILQAHNMTAQQLGQSVANSIKPCLDQQVSAGKITSQQETQALQRIQQGGFPGGQRPGGNANHSKPNGNGSTANGNSSRSSGNTSTSSGSSQ